MRTLLTRYRTALRSPGMARVITAAFAAYLLSGMMSLSLLLTAERTTGSYATAGLVAGAYAAALAFAAPAWGRLVDRRGPRTPLALAVALQAVAVSTVVFAANSGTPALLVAAAGLAGACSPPTSTIASRVMAGVPDEAVQRTLFALSGFITECVFVVGPLVVAALVLLFHPLWAVGLAAVASAAGALLLRGSTAVRRLEEETARTAAGGSSGWNAAQVRVLTVVALGAFAIGGVQVSIVAHAQGSGSSEGVFVALVATGGVVASFLYGGLSLPGSLPAQLAACLGLYGLLILALAFEPGLLVSAALLLLIGAATGPADGIEAMLIGKCTPPAAQARAFAVLVTANWIGFALGSAVGGALVERASLAAGVVATGLAALAAAALALFSRVPTGPTSAAAR
ncbi:MFS transporter [Saccharothrix xinjiangensis]|uniref:MFS transporter n=1 Tax=Saccharothrix xinjiangensis TaxID=204798 RepID=A0ABV9XXS7_9PSEU